MGSAKCTSSYYLIECPICDNVGFEAHTLWRKHMNKIHKILQPYQCTECLPKNVKYANKGGLDQHIQNIHRGIRKFKCKLCPKSFFSKKVFGKSSTSARWIETMEV